MKFTSNSLKLICYLKSMIYIITYELIIHHWLHLKNNKN